MGSPARGDAREVARWVVGVDGSECSRHAALWAAAHASGRADELQFTSAWSLPMSAATTPFDPMLATTNFDLVEQSARETLTALAGQLGPSTDVPITTTFAQSGASALLLEAAENAALLVVGSRGRGGFGRLVLGSTSTQCATHATVPTVVVPLTAPRDASGTICVAFDGSTNSIAALHWALDFAGPNDVIECVSVWDDAPMMVGEHQFAMPEGGELARQRFEHQAASVADAHPNGSRVRRQFVLGRPRTELAERAERSDLLVMGARGHGALGSVVLGSVSTYLLHHVECPMVVVPPTTSGDVRVPDDEE